MSLFVPSCCSLLADAILFCSSPDLRIDLELLDNTRSEVATIDGLDVISPPVQLPPESDVLDQRPRQMTSGAAYPSKGR